MIAPSAVFESFLEGTTEAFYVKDEAGRYQLINRVGARLIGRQDEQIIGLRAQDLFDPESAARIQEDDRRVLASGQAESYQREVVVAGRQRVFSVTKWPWRDPESGDAYLLGIARDITEQTQAERALRESERRFRTLVQHAPEAIVLFDLDQGRFIDANTNAEELFGLSKSELLKVGPVEMSPPTQPDGQPSTELAMAALAEAGAGGVPGFEWVHRNAQGVEIPCEVRLVNMPDDPRIIRGSIIDISERKRARRELLQREAALEASEQRYRTLVEQSLVGILIYREGRIVFANPAMAKTLGYRVDELIELSPRRAGALLHPEGRRSVLVREQSRLRGAEVATRNSCRALHRDGSSRWLETFSSVVDYGGAPALLLATVDVTAQREAEEALRNSEERHRTLLRALPDPIFLLDDAGRIVELDADSGDDLPFAPSELLGRRFADILTAEARSACNEAISAARRSGQTHTFSYTQVIARDELPREFEARVASAGGGRAVVAVRNVTQRSQLEAQLRQAQKMDAIGRLAGGVAHDFNNLLTVLMGNAELGLAMIDRGHPVEEHLEQILRTTEQAATLTRQLLTFSRQQPVSAELLDLNRLVTDSRSMLRRLIEEDIRLSTRLTDDLPPVRADPSQLEQILVNLVVNSRDAMSRDGGELVVETGERLVRDPPPPSLPLAPGRYVTMEVRDTGTGIPQELRKHLFEPFLTTKPVGKGTGLGLATSYGIAKQHGGHIEVESEVGVGTTMRVYLPVEESEEPLESVAVEPTPPRGRETLMVAEDDQAVREFLCEALRELGYEVLSARDGFEAIEMLESADPRVDLLLSDVVMPGMGGRELSEKARQLRPGIKVLFASGYTDDVILERQLMEDGLDLVRKPFRLPALAVRLREMLDG